MFENDVKTYGTQASPVIDQTTPLFENDVKTYGTQAPPSFLLPLYRLRMM